MQTIAITGASGFIGKKLVTELVQRGEFEVRVLSRNLQRDLEERNFPSNVTIVEGDLHDVDSLKRLVKAGCTVVHLAYLWNVDETKNLVVIENLLAVCKEAGIGRLVHCSTAAVVGRVQENYVAEEIHCNPRTEYGITKLKIEQEVKKAVANGDFDAVIVRPTAVFGNEGEQLKKLANDLRSNRRWLNYLKSCLFGRRKMNLVHIDNVVSAIIFLIQYSVYLDGGVFIVSDDDDQKNNFYDVEHFLMNMLAIEDYKLPRVPIPLYVLSFLLWVRGRNNINPLCAYDPSKLLELGYKRPMLLQDGLVEYARWYQSYRFPELVEQ